MKILYTPVVSAVCAVLFGWQGSAATLTSEEFAALPALSARRLSGSLTVGYDSNYIGRGMVISHAVAEGDSSELIALKTNYDIGRMQKKWSIDSTISYKTVSSGHTLYGPSPYKKLNHLIPGMLRPKNVENEFGVVTALKYTGEQGSVSFGHDFVRGGLLGAMAKHFREQSASCVNEVFVSPAWTPAPWAEVGCTVRLSFQGVQGWWFEPHVTLKAPVIGTAEQPKVVAMLTLAMSATANYFDEGHHANANGAQAWWVKASVPWFVANHFVVTPGVSFNWLGSGAIKAQRVSGFKSLPFGIGNETLVPYRNFAVVAGVNCSYTF